VISQRRASSLAPAVPVGVKTKIRLPCEALAATTEALVALIGVIALPSSRWPRTRPWGLLAARWRIWALGLMAAAGGAGAAGPVWGGLRQRSPGGRCLFPGWGGRGLYGPRRRRAIADYHRQQGSRASPRLVDRQPDNGFVTFGT